MLHHITVIYGFSAMRAYGGHECWVLNVADEFREKRKDDKCSYLETPQKRQPNYEGTPDTKVDFVPKVIPNCFSPFK